MGISLSTGFLVWESVSHPFPHQWLPPFGGQSCGAQLPTLFCPSNLSSVASSLRLVVRFVLPGFRSCSRLFAWRECYLVSMGRGHSGSSYSAIFPGTLPSVHLSTCPWNILPFRQLPLQSGKYLELPYPLCLPWGYCASIFSAWALVKSVCSSNSCAWDSGLGGLGKGSEICVFIDLLGAFDAYDPKITLKPS